VDSVERHPLSKGLYSEQEAKRILERAMQRQDRDFSREHLEQMAEELGITPAELRAAEDDLLAEYPAQPLRDSFIVHRRQQFKKHVAGYTLLLVIYAAISSVFFVTPPPLAIGLLAILSVLAGALWLVNEAYEVFLVNAGERFDSKLDKWATEHERRQLLPPARHR
jgi:hypothetical protein